MIGELVAAGAIGISFANTWMCMLVSIGCTVDDEKSGFNFILGRFIGLVIIGLVIAAIGAFVNIPPIYFIAIFGILTVLFGVTVLLRAFNIELKLPSFLKGPEKTKGQHMHGKGGGNCVKAKNDNRHKFKNKHVFALGVFRGATPCLKLMILAPLLIAVDFWLAFAMVIVFAAASTVYPIIGFLFGSLLRKFERYHKHLKVASALILILVGVYSILNGVLVTDHSGGL
ncbi:MAG: sulfite exporter TauE/SafE family protein [Thermoplasmata archaeon]|nr:sulfite exporter TauE/SafE family protein [Thermoplasmata archaeon]